MKFFDDFYRYKYWIKYILCGFAVLICGIIYVLYRHFDTLNTNNDVEDNITEESSIVASLDDKDIDSNDTFCYVYICGEVNNPGVYECNLNDRVYNLLEKAGGALVDADLDSINLAEEVTDGSKIYIPNKNEKESGSDSVVVTSDDKTPQKVNINTATKSELMTLSGIGEAKAEAIIAYRQQYGKFSSIEDIKNISGIKDAAFEKIKNFICI